ncbi:hypothetical protein RCL_jg17012.t1 [Rhizophagus clarus]|uniref:Uncharacterized protein n=1 Tax=Rhizophagus clarus TaxID=94130 RepID=A0A8H3QRS0_9GLOM|nr:hypothetical protein RCL_jg17012.t1 [Rhizophagus clarus]
MTSTSQKTIHENTEEFFKCYKQSIFEEIVDIVQGIMLNPKTKDFFRQIDVSEELIRSFLKENKDVTVLVETPNNANEYLSPKFQKKSARKKLKKLQQQQRTRVYKKYLLARVRLIPNYECLKAYNGSEWIVRLEGIPVRWFPAL